ncbi:uncharacterized protein JCM10292_001992 [Rhodotorula paludigena]|uniref:uncharacterized protein n=1 Tax=Rhodotorula paludigena TaxID=86838 RepID=UPI00316C11FF
MQPVASTSRASSAAPGFRSSRARPPPRASAELAATKARASLRVPAGYAFEDSDFPTDDYEPRQGQVKRRKARKEGDKEGREKKRRKKDGGEKKGAPDKAGDKALRKKERREKRRRDRKGKGRAEDAAGADDDDENDAKVQKRVRIAAPASETSVYVPSSDDEDAADDAAELRRLRASLDGDDDSLGLDSVLLDLADPLRLPADGHVRGKRFWQGLERGVYRSALHDVAHDRTHLGRALVEWETLRRRREAEELEFAAGTRTGLDDADGEEVAASSPSATPRPLARRGPGRPRSSTYQVDPHNSLLPISLSRHSTDDDAAQRRFDEDGREIIPLPSSVALAKMARWPSSHPSDAAECPSSASSVLDEALLASYEEAQRQARVVPPLPRQRVKPRSAYSAGGPFAPASPAASDSSGSGSDSDSLAEADEPLDELPPAIAAIPPLLSSIVTRLVDFVPKEPLPTYDLWSAAKRDEEARKDDKARGIERGNAAPGWEEVLACARETGVPEHILAKLEQQLVALFGPSNKPPVELPLPGNPTLIDRSRPSRKLRAVSSPAPAPSDSAAGVKRQRKERSDKGKRRAPYRPRQKKSERKQQSSGLPERSASADDDDEDEA